MQINLIAVGKRMPKWICQGYEEYTKRLPRECVMQLREIAPGIRGKNRDLRRIVRQEGERMIAAIPAGAHVVALDISGQPWSTPDLALAMQRWMLEEKAVALLVGGAEGLSEEVREQARESWSLSKLTFPHPLVRVIIAEQIYRAWSLLQNHPYHR